MACLLVPSPLHPPPSPVAGCAHRRVLLVDGVGQLGVVGRVLPQVRDGGRGSRGWAAQAAAPVLPPLDKGGGDGGLGMWRFRGFRVLGGVLRFWV